MAREAIAQARISQAELAEWRAKAAAAGVSLSELIRQAMDRTHTWTAPAAAAANERSRQLARIGSNLNQIARWENTYKRKAAAVQVIGHLSTIERELHNLRIRGGADAD